MRYTAEKTFLPTEFSGPDRTIVVKANGGTVEVFAPLDFEADEWISSGVYSADEVDFTFHGNCPLKIVPNGGAEYNVY